MRVTRDQGAAELVVEVNRRTYRLPDNETAYQSLKRLEAMAAESDAVPDDVPVSPKAEELPPVIVPPPLPVAPKGKR